jgi:hypothetical protein
MQLRTTAQDGTRTERVLPVMRYVRRRRKRKARQLPEPRLLEPAGHDKARPRYRFHRERVSMTALDISLKTRR